MQMTAYPMPCTQAGLITGCFLLRVHLLTMVSQRSTPTLSSSSRFHSCFFSFNWLWAQDYNIYIYICPQILMVDFPNKIRGVAAFPAHFTNPAGRCIVALWNPRILGVHAWKASWYVRPLWKWPPCRARVVGEEMGKRIYIDFIYSRNVGVSMLQPDDGFMTLDLQDVGSFTSLK